ncbi:outer membrane beta-barrel protein [Vibrio agarivorans]|uniref:outer membrane beta-barrel protein n=1 Tax=Vibrio agarivorans TaxID=153622 RepID=UPI0025B53CDF|nr:outer membrane beta-barrel protein [Vibrio agarivorans]MDN3660863.1 outer membrane beta-barrel protein [Vibrio agarivorans]
MRKSLALALFLIPTLANASIRFEYGLSSFNGTDGASSIAQQDTEYSDGYSVGIGYELNRVMGFYLSKTGGNKFSFREGGGANYFEHRNDVSTTFIGTDIGYTFGQKVTFKPYAALGYNWMKESLHTTEVELDEVISASSVTTKESSFFYGVGARVAYKFVSIDASLLQPAKSTSIWGSDDKTISKLAFGVRF